MDFSRLDRNRALLGAGASIILIVGVLFLPWYSLSDTPERHAQEAWLCGRDDYSCTGFETFPILRWLLLAGALAPIILGYILVRGHKLSWAPGELTMVVGFTAFVLIGYNGIIARPGERPFGEGLEYGYWLAFLASIAIAATGFLRSMASGGRQTRKAPGTI
jgi:hypothetical protein